MSERTEVQTAAALREQILALVNTYHDLEFAPREFVPGETPVPVSGRVFDADELLHLVDASLDFWLTTGRYAKQFEREFARAVGVRHALLCNSGSSANLLASAALTSPKLGERRLQPGRRGDHRRRGLPDDGQPDHPERARAGLRRRRARHLQPRRLAARSRARAAHARDHGRAHARQPVRPRRGDAPSRRSTTSG